MNYFLIANNPKLTESSINKLDLNIDTDIVVLFNFLIPMKFGKIYNYSNKICVSRLRPDPYKQISTVDPNLKEFYCNMSKIKVLQNLFKEIYFVPHPNNIITNKQNYIDNINAFKYDSKKLKYFDYDIEKLRQKLHYQGTGLKYQVSTGVIYYNVLQDILKSNDKIILVGFTSELSHLHESEWEKNYFLNEVYSGKCFLIDSYGVCNF